MAMLAVQTDIASSDLSHHSDILRRLRALKLLPGRPPCRNRGDTYTLGTSPTSPQLGVCYVAC